MNFDKAPKPKAEQDPNALPSLDDMSDYIDAQQAEQGEDKLVDSEKQALDSRQTTIDDTPVGEGITVEQVRANREEPAELRNEHDARNSLEEAA